MTGMLPISSLMSPPEPSLPDSFDSSKSAKLQSHKMSPPLPSSKPGAEKENSIQKLLISPPVSPWVRTSELVRDHADQKQSHKTVAESGPDPVLYPEELEDVKADPPLFPSSPVRRDAEMVVEKHMAMHMNQFPPSQRPTREEYMMALSFVSCLSHNIKANPGGHMKRMRDEVDEQWSQSKRLCGLPGISALNRQPQRIAPAMKKVSPKTHPIHVPRAPKEPRAPRQRKTATPRAPYISSPLSGRLDTPEGARAPAAKRPEDVDYHSLPDYSPPLFSLDAGNAKALKTDWASTNPLNLSTDPDRHMLHEAELNLASTLRLSCATYLCSKRRIFEGRLRALRVGKEFRKTDAQQACKIDVNKASKLWTAYNKVGWFERGWFMKWL